MKGLLGRKLGMTQVFATDGTLIPVSVVEVLPNVVLQKKTAETDNYEAIQLGVTDVKEQRANKSEIAHAAKANTAPKKFVREIIASEMMNLEVGDVVKAGLFSAGEFVDVSGISRGRGFNGNIVRGNQKTGPKAHGSGYHRGIGSLATGGLNPANIKKGRVMPGQHGGYSTTNQNLEIIKVDEENNYILIKGNIPGPRRGNVVIKSTVKRNKVKDAIELVDNAKEESNNA
ncbi:50S ribosomal protein L3 [Erysipelothrix sp. HDW6C]|uniref:50S ribosomal protein L3 n=1 Tax=Erysipelothrix sp. HDW6C TaxID=2714930 RepID=UPI00140E0964|nr:50S ribosomal protein L3 [Erysipelothrix sp. HDW6C]QIK69788.1 50S ribosomal protein L3 [Erysipelothrix sp. HDW6C]